MTNLIQLQGQVKRDPVSYREEFLQQLNHFESLIVLFQVNPSENNEELSSLISFLSHVSFRYAKETQDLPAKIMNILDQHHLIMNPAVRKVMVQALCLLRSKGQVSTIDLLSLLFKLFRCKDTNLRELLYTTIVQSLKALNQNHKDNKLNKSLQNFMYTMLSDNFPLAAKKSLDVMISLYKKKIWDDAKTVNIIAEACLSQHMKVASTAIHFFLGQDDDKNDEDSDDEDDNGSLPNILEMRHAAHVGGKTKARKNKMRKALALIKKKERKSKSPENFNFSAIHLLNDPQGFIEKLFEKLRKSNEIYEFKMVCMSLISRVIGIHKLVLLSFYPYLIKYLKPHQNNVTLLLTFAAQSSHDLAPPDVIESVILAIANNFVNDSCSAEVITVGLNAIREICVRCSFCMPEFLLSDLIQYKSYKDKGVSNGARSLIQLFRDVNPEMLPKKDRGKMASLNIRDKFNKKAEFGHTDVHQRIEGAEILDSIDSSNNAFDDETQGWDVMSDSSDGEGGDWIDVSEGEEGLEIPVSDDDDDEDKEENGEIVESNNKSSIPIEQRRILTPQDFKLIEENRRSNQVKEAIGMKRKSEEIETKEIVDINDIEKSLKRRKQTYDERMDSIKAGREGRDKYGSRKGKKDKLVSSTNKEKSKKKNFIMAVHKRSVREKSKMSMRDRQIALREQALKQKKRKN